MFQHLVHQIREALDSSLLQMAALFPVFFHLQFQALSLNKGDSRGYFLEEHLQTAQKLTFFLTFFSSLMRKVILFEFEERWLSFFFC